MVTARQSRLKFFILKNDLVPAHGDRHVRASSQRLRTRARLAVPRSVHCWFNTVKLFSELSRFLSHFLSHCLPEELWLLETTPETKRSSIMEPPSLMQPLSLGCKQISFGNSNGMNSWPRTTICCLLAFVKYCFRLVCRLIRQNAYKPLLT